MIRWLRTLALRLKHSRAYPQPRRGQATIMLALMMIPLIGMLGLAVDGGVYLYARRTAQAAADAGALAGARKLSKSFDAQADVTTVVGANGQGNIVPTVLECRYVDDTNTPVGPASCTSPIPSNASGVLVRTQETVPAFFLPVIPGAPRMSVVTASAIARVQVATGLMADAPFIVCGSRAWDVTNGTNPEVYLNILDLNDQTTINPAAINRTFRIWDPQLEQAGEASCDEGSRFKGMANSGANRLLTVPNWLEYKSGTTVGQLPDTLSDVNGPEGCSAGISDFDGCVLILPLATSNPPNANGTSTQVYGVRFAAFRMERVNTNSYNGTLLDAYIISAPGSNGWTPATGGLVSIRMAG